MQIVRRAGGLAPGMVGHLVGVEPAPSSTAWVASKRRRRGPRRAGPVSRARTARPKAVAGLYGQLIGRDVLEPQVQGAAARRARRPPSGRGGRRSGRATGGEGRPRQLRGPHRLARRMVAPEKGQGFVVQRLHPQRQARPRPRRRRRTGGLGVGGIGLQRDLDVGPAVHRARRGRSSPPTRSGAISEGVPPPKKIEASRARPVMRPAPKVGQDRAGQRRLFAASPAVAEHVEVAIGADARAIGPVE